jgi:peptidoglycan/LPS O-acetylase OafA/YrhL
VRPPFLTIMVKHPRRTSVGHIPELDGIRGLAVGLVLAEHFWPTVGFWRTGLALAGVGWVGVDLFFVLSGFLITGILVDNVEQPDYFRRFYIRRAFRIFPLYYVFLILIFSFLALWHGGRELARLRTEWGSPVWFFLYLANFIATGNGKFPPFGPLAPLWSLQIEEQYYLVFPTIVRFFRKRLSVVLIVTFFGALAWRTAMLIYYPNNWMMQYEGTLSRLDALAAGGLAALLIRHPEKDQLQRATRFVTPLLLAALVGFYLWVGSAPGSPLTRTVGYSLNALAFASLILWVMQHRNKRGSAVFRWAPACWLGKISYGVYLLQLPVQSLVKLITKSPMGTSDRAPAESLVWLVAILAVAWLSWRYFETPLLNYGQKLAARKLPANAASPP